MLVHNWGRLLRLEMGRDAGRTHITKAKILEDVRWAGESNVCDKFKIRGRLQVEFANTSSPGTWSNYCGKLNRLADGDNDGIGGDRSPEDLGGDQGGNNTGTNNRRDDNSDNRRREFLFVKASNVNINTFTGFNLSRSPYIPFSKFILKLILTQGHDGEELLKILDHVETYGDKRFTEAKLQALAEMYPKAYEYARAANAALLNWIEGAAHGLVDHGCENVLDAWRRLYNRYIPAAEDFQSLFMEELMMLKPVSEAEVDALFTEVERLTEWYIKTDSKGEATKAQWVRTALIKQTPASLVFNHH